MAELEQSLGIVTAPEFVHQVRWTQAIPQYTVGHRNRVERIMSRVRDCSGLYLTGNAYEGVGPDACVGHSRSVAESVADLVGRAEVAV